MTYDTTFYDTIAPGCRESAHVVVPMLLELFHPNSVVDVGCGEGHWLAEFAREGCLVTGLDGTYVPPERLAIDPVDFRAVDLSAPLPAVESGTGGRRYDLALSLEVAEHVPASAADDLVAALVAAAPVVVFSAAIPGQGGAGHVNEQWPRYWWERFAAKGYVGTGALRWVLWTNDRVENWYRQNLFVYADPRAISSRVRYLWEGHTAEPLPLVHPVLWDARR